MNITGSRNVKRLQTGAERVAAYYNVIEATRIPGKYAYHVITWAIRGRRLTCRCVLAENRAREEND
jgi:hypothetical protein